MDETATKSDPVPSAVPAGTGRDPVDREAGRTGRRPLALVVDDELAIGELIALVLEEEGWSVIRAHDGAQAWDILQSRRVDLLLSDIMMPRLDGLELLQLVRTSPHHGSLPVILTSAVSRIDATDVVFLAKPFDLDTLVTIVERCLSPARTRWY